MQGRWVRETYQGEGRVGGAGGSQTAATTGGVWAADGRWSSAAERENKGEEWEEKGEEMREKEEREGAAESLKGGKGEREIIEK